MYCTSYPLAIFQGVQSYDVDSDVVSTFVALGIKMVTSRHAMSIKSLTRPRCFGVLDRK